MKFICVQPSDNYYIWQVHMWLESLKEAGHSDKAVVLIFVPSFRPDNTKWQQIVDLYPEAEFHFYKDTMGITDLIKLYIPVLRPYTLMRYFQDYPEASKTTWFYCDNDVLFTKKFDVSKYEKDDIVYLSDTNGYINSDYFDSKIKDVLPEKLEKYKTIDVLDEACKIVGISRSIAEKNKLNSGGAQYLLKNIDSEFWKKVMEDCIKLRRYFLSINKEYFKDENSGLQGWCSDMWSLLYNLWFRGIETKNIPEMDFIWASDPIEKLESMTIFHNAGITSENMGYPAFYKGKYHQGENPLKDKHLDTVLNNEESAKRCTHYYTTKLVELGNKYNLSY